MENTQHRVYELAVQVAEDLHFELVSADFVGRARRSLVRVVIDKEGGVTIADCEKMSRALEALLDVEDPISGAYMLEVSSPGLDRPLVSQRDFERSVGKLVRIVTSSQIDRQTFFIGRISDVGDGWVRLKPEQRISGKPIKVSKRAEAVRGEGADDIFIPLETIAKARLEIE
ncbi:MAG TPA: ribosome maturation factor RimP [Dissulfurispiraceae bacterium]|nr:ribosome maturation factor RimP [Dissulfurispiraceae bacterium]